MSIFLQEGLRIEHGRNCTFVGTKITRSGSDNIAIAPNQAGFQERYACRGIDFVGGTSTEAYYNGIAIYGSDVTVTGMRFYANSRVGAGQNAGIAIAAAARGVAISGCRSGELESSAMQKHGCVIISGANNFSVVGNVLTYNAAEGLRNYNTLATTRVVAFNAGTTLNGP